MSRDTGTVSVEFRCPRPQDVFSVEILRSIECTAKSCNGDIIQTEYGSTPLTDFNRTFTWNLKASAQQAFQLDFTSTGLRQINPSETCPDKHTYSLQALQATGKVAIGTYCRTGSFHGAQVLKQGSFSVQVPAKQKLQGARFGVSVGEEIKSLAKMKLILPERSSSTELLSPNYPGSFPDDDQMEWEFQTPAKYNATIDFLDHTQPRCLKKSTAVEYHRRGREASVRGLSVTQSTQIQGNFSLTLRNCEMDRARDNTAGLSVHFKVAAVQRSRPVLCEVDLRKEERLSLYIEARPGSECEMKMNFNTKERITLPSKSITQLSFQDCSPEDVRVTARRIIACQQLNRCPKVSLAVPSLPSCLPAPLSNVTWTLLPPPHGAVELLSPSNPLRQSPPGQPCNDSIILQVVEDDGTSLGQFCPEGAIKSIQIHANVSVTASGVGDGVLRTSKLLLHAVFRGEIRERYIFNVAPEKGVQTVLATPGWPEGMKSYSTVSWIISVPAKQEAHLMFTNITQPKCNNRHTNIRVQSLGSLEEMYSRREDEEADSEITISKSFYLNMSNCMPERGHFTVVSQITLHKNKNLLLIAVLSVVAALLLIIFIALGVVCVVIRKKKRQMNHQVSIYNPNGTSFLPGHNGLPKSPEEDDHVYASIEDSLVYTHLLRKGVEMGVYGEADTYRPFTGPTEPPHSQGMASERPEVGVYRPFVPPSHQGPPLPNRPPSQAQCFVKNDLYCTESNSEEEDCGDLTRSAVLGPRMDPEGGD
ncbi:CUB domain-containing protein 1-like [Lampris incognitus]|uniref:CUB domain-containing protein 1-like n=1 Tax=Lampris incognitus TaxID=2546036 RepID=UPI0024B55585|nr:CUB domain-containing protein 1-like [Lampris incognitus]